MESLEHCEAAFAGYRYLSQDAEKHIETIRAVLTSPDIHAPDDPEQSCAGCPKDVDCDDYRIDGQTCDGKKDWFKCNECGKYLPTENGLEKHKRYHDTPAPLPEDVREAIKYLTAPLHTVNADVRDAINILIAAASAPVWRTMESAPRDGAEVLLYFGKNISPKVLSGSFNQGEDKWCCTYCSYDDPTHWMPLPSPPATSEG